MNQEMAWELKSVWKSVWTLLRTGGLLGLLQLVLELTLLGFLAAGIRYTMNMRRFAESHLV